MNVVTQSLKLVKYPHPALRHPAKPVSAIDDKIRFVANELLRLMYEHKGLGLAAPQIGVPYQMFAANYEGDPDKKEYEGVYINPVIMDKKGTMEGDEGCLSFPDLYQKVRRARTVRVQAYTLDGKLVEMEASDLPSRIWQHETDHLHGVLFIDKLGPIGKLSARGMLREFEAQYAKGQRKGEIPNEEEIRKQIAEWESQA